MTAGPGSKKLGQILIEQGVLAEANLNKALEIQKHEGGFLGQVLVRLRLVSEEDIVTALATQFNYPYLSVDNFNINPEATRDIPLDLIKKYTFMPIDKINNILTVVMADPSDKNAVWEIESASHCRIQAFVGTVSEIESTISKYYNLPDIEKEKTEDQKVKMAFKSMAEEKQKGGHRPS